MPAWEEEPICVRCRKHPDEIMEYQPTMTGTKLDPNTYVIRNEGTYNRENGHFLCTDCYIKAGMPLGVAP